MYRQVGAALLLPHHLGAVLQRWQMVARVLAESPRNRARHTFF